MRDKKKLNSTARAISLSSIEDLALSLIRPFDVNSLQPVAKMCTTKQDYELWDYYRFVLSSSVQSSHIIGISRTARWMVFDKTSGGFLGLWAITDAQLPWTPVTEYMGGAIGGNSHKNPTAMHVVQLKRCLPLYEFGKLTGGKLLVLLAGSTECLRTQEMKYVIDLAAMLVTTLHGKSSQYNRLHSRGLKFVGDFDGKGLYIQEFRKHGFRFLLGEKSLGKKVTHGFADQYDYWLTRWCSNRIEEHTVDGMVSPDIDAYRLSHRRDYLSGSIYL